MTRVRSILLVFLTLALVALLPSPSSAARSWHYSFWSDSPQKYLEVIERDAPRAPGAAPRQEEGEGFPPDCEGGSGRPAPAMRPFPATAGILRAGIVTHHFLAHRLMVDFFECLRLHSSPKKILLLGPNHYDQGTQRLSLSSLPWKTPFGPLRTDRRFVARMKGRLGLPEDPDAFSGEHSVGVLIPFLKHYFPEAEIVPVLLRANASESLVQGLGDLLRQFLSQPNHLVLLSMDFSHDCTREMAEVADQAAGEAIRLLQPDRALGLQVDCRKGLRALLEALRRLGGVQVHFRAHTNSAQLTGQMDQDRVTSYFTILFLKGPWSSSLVPSNGR